MSHRSQIHTNIFNLFTDSVANPAAGSGTTFTTLQNQRLELISMFLTLVTDANVANRIVRIHMPGLASDPVFPAHNVQAASTTIQYVFMTGGVNVDHSGTNNVMYNIMPINFFSEAGFPIRIDVSNIQVGDQLSNIALTFKRWYNL